MCSDSSSRPRLMWRTTSSQGGGMLLGGLPSTWLVRRPLGRIAPEFDLPVP